MIDWDNAISKAKRILGYSHDEYIEDYSRVVEKTKEILYDSRKKWQKQYKTYMNSKEWRILRNTIIKKADNKCQDCEELAQCVHHLTYDNLYTKNEIFDCIPLCNFCHMARHNLKQGVNENNVFIGKCYLCERQTYIFRMDSWKTQIMPDKSKVIGGWFSFCKRCIEILNLGENRSLNECTSCYDHFLGKKNESECYFCKRRSF